MLEQPYIESVDEAKLELDCYTVAAIVEHLAKTNGYITYGELAKSVGAARGERMDPRGFASCLGRIQHYCDELGLPCLSVMVISTNTHAAGTGFIDCYREIHPERSSMKESEIRRIEKDAVLEQQGWQSLYDYLGIDHEAPAMENKFHAWDAERVYKEGRKVIEGSRIEATRNAEARALCLKLKGRTCLICGFNAHEVYGDEQKEIIEVHHMHPLAS